MFAQFGKRFECPNFFARFKDGFHRRFADAFDGREAETDGFSFTRGRGRCYAFVHVRLQDLDSEFTRLGDVFAQFLRVHHVVCHHGAEKFDRKIRLQIRGLIRDNGVGGGVRFVETVAGKLPANRRLVRLRGGDFVLFGAALDELLALLLHFLDLFLCPLRAAKCPPRRA